MRPFLLLAAALALSACAPKNFAMDGKDAEQGKIGHDGVYLRHAFGDEFCISTGRIDG